MSTKIKEAVKLCALFLRLENVLNLQVLGGPEQGFMEDEAQSANKELDILLRCVNLVCAEIAADYFPLKKQRTMQSGDGYIKFDDFGDTVVDIISVKQNGAVQAFKRYPAEIKTAPGSVDICYTYLPAAMGLEDSPEFSRGKIHERTLAYGAAAEYCLISGMYEEALIWDKRYKDSLIGAVKSVRVVNLPRRRWA